MHELSITQALLEQVLRHAHQAEAQTVREIHISIGRLSSVVDESVQFYWPLIAKDTIAADARLIFHRIPARFLCAGCGRGFLFEEQRDYICPHCNSLDVTLESGEGLRLDSIEID